MGEFDEVVHDPAATPAGADQGRATPFGANGVVDWSAIPKDARFVIDYKGQEVIITGEKLKETLQMGHLAGDRLAEVNAKELELSRRHQPFVKFNDFLEKNPDVKEIVRRAARRDWRGVMEAIPHQNRGAVAPGFTPGNGDGNAAPNGDGDNDYYLSRIEGVRGEVRQMFGDLMATLDSRFEQLGGGVQSLQADAAESRAITFLKTNPAYARLATDANIALAKEHQRVHGGDLLSAFRNVTFEKLPSVIEEEVVTRYGIDRESYSLPGSSPPTVNGLTLDDKTMSDLFEDPDRLAQHAEAIKAHRRRVKGKERYPGIRPRGR